MSRRTKHAAKRSESLQPVAGSNPLFGLVGLTLVLLATFLAYSPALQGGLLWDDDAHVTRPELQSLDGLYRIWFVLDATQQYYPLLHSAFWIEHKLWGDSVLGYHLVNLLWHSLAVVLVYLIVKKLDIPGALLAAAIFALHPVMVESVAWISEQKNTLSAVFYLGAMLIYLKFDRSRRLGHYLIALLLFVLGLLTKTVTATLPAALLVIFWWQRGTLEWKRDLRPLLPMFALGAAAGMLTAWVERTLIGAQGADFDLTLVQRFLLAGRVVWFYVAKLLWPANLIFIYPRWVVDPAVWLQWLFPIAALAMLVALWAMRRRSRAPLAGWLFFCGTLFPALGFVNVFPFVYSFVADHFQYLASLGLIVLAAAAIARRLARLPRTSRLVGAAACVLYVVMLGVVTYRQSGMYVDGVTLYETTLARNPDCWMAHNNLGLTLLAQGNQEDAIAHMQEALRINPRDAATHSNLGTVYAELGQLQPAIDEYRAALRSLPEYVDARLNLGMALSRAGKLPEALAELEAALAMQPNNARAHKNLAVALALAGRFQEATDHLNQSLALNPNDPEAHNNLGFELARAGQIPEAIEHFHKAIEINPNEAKALGNLGLLLVQRGDPGVALEHLEKAIQLNPQSADYRNGMGDALRQTGWLPEAIEQYQTALRLNPDFLQAYANLAQAYNLADRPQDAIATAEKGIEVAHAIGQQAVAEQIEQWLTHYNIELQRARDAEAPTDPPPTP